MNNLSLNIIRVSLLTCLIIFTIPKIMGQNASSDTCAYLAQAYDGTYELRGALSKSRDFDILDSICLAHLKVLDKYCPCSKKNAEVTRLSAGTKFYRGMQSQAFDQFNEKINRCKNTNDSTVLYLYKWSAIYHLRNDDYYNMKRDLDAAIKIGTENFDPSYIDLFAARVNLGNYYRWKQDYQTALDLHLSNEKDIENIIFVDTSAHIDNLEHIIDMSLILKDQKTVDEYTEKIFKLIKGSRYEKEVQKDIYGSFLDYYMNIGDYTKAEYYFNTFDSTAFGDFINSLPLIRFLVIQGKSQEAMRKLEILDLSLDSNQVPKHHFARVNVALEKLQVIDINQDIVSSISASIHNNYVNLINDSPYEQNDNIKAIRDKYTAVIHRLIQRGQSDLIPIVYNNMNNIKNASAAYYPKLFRLLEQSNDIGFKQDFSEYKRLCSLLNNGEDVDSLNYFADKIQQRLYDIGVKWHNNIGIKEIQDKITPDDVFLDFYQIENINGKESLYLFLVTKDQVEFVPYDNILDTLSLQLLSSNYVNNGKSNKALYNYLLKPLEPFLQNKKNVYLSPDGVLNQIALDILSPTGSKNKIFADMYSVKYIENSKSLFENQIQSVSDNQYMISGGIRYDCSNSDGLLASHDQNRDIERSNRQYLEGSMKEVDLIVNKLTGINVGVKTLTGCDATKDNVLQGLGENKVTHVHLSTHGLANINESKKADKYFTNNRQSQLIFATLHAQDNAGLSAIEIINQDQTNKKLVFLSACNTGIGTYSAGFGNASVANAFKKAGAQQVVATLWPIPDDITVLLCDYFYEHYLMHHDANTALKHAQNELRKQNLPPEKWAAFRVMN